MSALWYPGKPPLRMGDFDNAVREFYGPALREQLNAPSAFTHARHQLHVVTRRWWEAERRTVTWHVRRSR